ncbi:MAG: hypothetical protein LBR71_01340 [Synergistaceae bacterium]|jgi:hypothetical protein|nr:hypothetical protein [Synergistaceae bacterium]
MGRGQKLKGDDAPLADELKGESGEDAEDRAEENVESGIGLAYAPPERESGSGDAPEPLSTEQPKIAAKKTRLVLVMAATYTEATRGGLVKIKKNVPFEADEPTARNLLATGLFKKEE